MILWLEYLCGFFAFIIVLSIWLLRNPPTVEDELQLSLRKAWKPVLFVSCVLTLAFTVFLATHISNTTEAILIGCICDIDAIAIALAFFRAVYTIRNYRNEAFFDGHHDNRFLWFAAKINFLQFIVFVVADVFLTILIRKGV